MISGIDKQHMFSGALKASRDTVFAMREFAKHSDFSLNRARLIVHENVMPGEYGWCSWRPC